MKRKESRELLMQIIFQAEAQKDFSEHPLEMHMRDKKAEAREQLYITDTYRAFIEHRETVDETINKCSDKWKTTRLPKAELAIMRIAVTEILYCDDIPVSVSINEAVELGKKYGDDGAYRYINGVLGKIAGPQKA